MFNTSSDVPQNTTPHTLPAGFDNLRAELAAQIKRARSSLSQTDRPPQHNARLRAIDPFSLRNRRTPFGPGFPCAIQRKESTP